jgi:carboxyl-terminal processing protease
VTIPRRVAPFGILIALLLALVFATGLVWGVLLGRTQGSSSASSDSNLQDFVTAYQLVTKQSYYQPVSKRRLVYAAIDGMLAATGDPHTLFLSPAENQTANYQLDGTSFDGIGAIVVQDSGNLRVVTPLPHSPAARAGLQSGDIVTHINGKKVSGMSDAVALNRIHGRPGTPVTLMITRAHRSSFSVTLRREHIPPVTAYGSLLAHHLGYIRILSFGSNTTQEVLDADTYLQQHKVRGIIIDVRENPGGYVDSAQQVASQFLSRGVVAYEMNSDRRLTSLPVLTGHMVIKLPVAVLVDEGTASAAEIMAGALQDYGRAVIVGTHTYGKGSMQSVFSLTDGSSIRITDRLWLTPLKHSIQSVGIRPNILIRPQVAPSRDADPGLSAAERYLLQHTPH